MMKRRKTTKVNIRVCSLLRGLKTSPIMYTSKTFLFLNFMVLLLLSKMKMPLRKKIPT